MAADDENFDMISWEKVISLRPDPYEPYVVEALFPNGRSKRVAVSAAKTDSCLSGLLLDMLIDEAWSGE